MQRTSQNMQVVEAFFTALAGRDRDAALALFDDNAYWDTPSGGAFSGRLVGRAGLQRLLTLLASARPEGNPVHELTLHADGDRVFAEFTWAPLADAAPRPPTRSFAVFELLFSKIAAVREFEAGPPAAPRSV